GCAGEPRDALADARIADKDHNAAVPNAPRRPSAHFASTPCRGGGANHSARDNACRKVDARLDEQWHSELRCAVGPRDALAVARIAGTGDNQAAPNTSHPPSARLASPPPL